jgi:hypothetical protein
MTDAALVSGWLNVRATAAANSASVLPGATATFLELFLYPAAGAGACASLAFAAVLLVFAVMSSP